MPQLPLQLLKHEQQGLSSENKKQWVSVSRVSVCKAASAHAHPRVNDPWVLAWTGTTTEGLQQHTPLLLPLSPFIIAPYRWRYERVQSETFLLSLLHISTLSHCPKNKLNIISTVLVFCFHLCGPYSCIPYSNCGVIGPLKYPFVFWSCSLLPCNTKLLSNILQILY
jgi:hypothetical protein